MAVTVAFLSLVFGVVPNSASRPVLRRCGNPASGSSRAFGRQEFRFRPLPALRPRRTAFKSMWDELPLGDFSELDPESLREFKKKMQISDREWSELGLPSIDEQKKTVKVDRSDDDEKLDQQAFQYVMSKLKEFRQDRDMGPRELKLVLMAGLDAQDAAQMTYEDEGGVATDRDGMLIALEEIIETGKIPNDRDSLRQLATELAQMPIIDPENKTRKMKKISAMEQGKEYVEKEPSLSPKDMGGLAAVWGVTAVPLLIGGIALYILYSSSGTTVQ